MEGPARMIGEPFVDLGMLVGGIVVGDGVDDLSGWDGAFDSIEKLDVFLVGVGLHAAAEDGSVEDVEGGEQRGRAVTLIIMCHGSALAWLERQSGLGAVQRLDLGLFVDGDDDGMGGRVHVEADDVFDLGGKGRIVGFLEGADAMGLEAMSQPEAVYGRLADADKFGHHAGRPMGDFAWRLSARQCQDLGDRLGRKGRFARLASFVAQQPIHALLGEALLPAPHVRPAQAAATRHLQDGQSLRRQKNDPSPQNMLLRAVAVADNGGQAPTIVGLKQDAHSLCHAPRIAWITALVNPPIKSVH